MRKIVLIIAISQLVLSLSVKEIENDPDYYNKKVVTITGRVKEIKFSVSKKGSRYTTLLLDDGFINIFSYDHLPFKKGDRVRVKGIFSETENGFGMEIKAEPEDITRVSGLNGIIVVGIILIAVLGRLLYRRYKAGRDIAYEMGVGFENYVQELFSKDDWTIARTAGDLSRKLGRKVEQDSEPDFVMRHKEKNRLFAIECKFRSNFWKGKEEYGILWAPKYKIRNYNRFWEKEKIPVFIVIGLSGTASAPQHLFLIPLPYLKHQFISENRLKKFERKPTDRFSLKEFV
ncbi:MAG: OB-fold nucleic acid binding domain-containing protein [bacterium]|nr:OB-fold nucleic acid binding domain-containing protein [bacterium]